MSDMLHLCAKDKKEKISIFRNLFKGREDVFAKYWISRRTGKQGYSPVCKNEWIPQICRKPCEKCGNKEYVPLDDFWIEKHLRGDIIIGIYPIQLDDRVNFLAFDFDKGNWLEDSINLLKFCQSIDLPAYLERSKSGNGAHLWIFFSQPISAAKVREFGFMLLKKAGSIAISAIDSTNDIDGINKISNIDTTANDYAIDISNTVNIKKDNSGFDRIFPNQDFLHDGGLGNLIALPSQYQARQKGNTLFLDPDNSCTPYINQWNLLSNIRRISEIDIDLFIDKFSEDTLSHFSASLSKSPPQSSLRDASQSLQPSISEKGSLKIIISNYLSIPIKDTDEVFYQFLRKNLVIHNPIFYDKKAKGFSTWDTPKMIYCINSKGGNYIIPRGFLKNIERYLFQKSIPFQIKDKSIKTPNRAFKCRIKIYNYQKKALQEILKNNMGILEAPPGYGKTIIALTTLVYRKQSTLIIVHTRELLVQWIQKIGDVLGIEKGDVGIIGGGKEKIGKKITVATYQSLVRKDLKILVDKIGYLIVDECHRVPANTFQKVVKKFKARYLLGLTATPFRKDKLQKLMFLYMGEIIHRIDPDKISSELKGVDSILEIRHTDFYPTFEKVKKYKKVIEALIKDENRNNLIVKDIIGEYSLDKSILVLTGRKGHCLEMSQRLGRKSKHSILTGNLSPKARGEILKDFKDKKIRVLIATGQLIGEGIDLPFLDTLFLVFPTSSKTRLIQYIGRVQRKNKGKSISKIYDYYDQYVSVLNIMFQKRKKIYEKLGIKQIKPDNKV
ncbi:MAG: DEAD/DEAH box helicase family protein [bacterium]